MSYQSIDFLFFSAGVILLYYIAGLFFKRRLQKYVLLAANVAFFAIAGVEYLPFILVTMLASYLAALAMGKYYAEEKQKLAAVTDKEEKKAIRAAAKAKAKRVLIVSLVITVGLLAVCKYTNFVINSINAVLAKAGAGKLRTFDLILPLGISFYTFMAVGYVLDVYWKRYAPEKNFVLFAVFLSYFPHIAQGPIDRYDKFRPQIAEGQKLTYDNITRGSQLMVWGLFKKLVVADRIGIFVDSIYNHVGNYRGIIFFCATVCYAIQIYTDFSGCIDIVSGISEMLGIKLGKNFNHPYFSKTIAEFWRRWHISLMEWFRDYIYMPVSGSRLVRSVKKHFKDKGQQRAEKLAAVIIPTLVIWLLTGLWHGASWKYVGWGAYYAVIMVLGDIFGDWCTGLPEKLKIKTDCFSWQLFRMARTFFITTMGRVIFRADSLGTAMTVYKKMFSCIYIKNFIGKQFFSYGLNAYDIILLAVAIFVIWAVDMIGEKTDVRDALAKQNLVFRWILLLALILSVVVFGVYGPAYNASSFIYEQF